jgi:hypothetical protein
MKWELLKERLVLCRVFECELCCQIMVFLPNEIGSKEVIECNECALVAKELK